MDENASIETIRPNSPLFDTGRVTFNDSVEMIQAQEAVDDHEDQNLKKENCYSMKTHKNLSVLSVVLDFLTTCASEKCITVQRPWRHQPPLTLPNIRKR